MIPLQGFHRTFLHKGSGMCEKLEWNCGRDALFVLPGVSELFFQRATLLLKTITQQFEGRTSYVM